MKTIFSFLFASVLAFGLLADPVPAGAFDGVEGIRKKDVSQPDEAPGYFDLMEDVTFGRSYREAPPLVPHAVDKYQIDIKNNECLKCHDWPQYIEENAPKVSETHYRDRDGNPTTGISGGRWFCNQCHAPQFDAEPLVESTFRNMLNE